MFVPLSTNGESFLSLQTSLHQSPFKKAHSDFSDKVKFPTFFVTAFSPWKSYLYNSLMIPAQQSIRFMKAGTLSNSGLCL